MGALRMLPQPQMTAQTLANEIRALLKFRPKTPSLDFQGAVNSLRVIDELVQNRRSQPDLCLKIPQKGAAQ